MKMIKAGEFKATCLALLDEVSEHRVELTITKRGKPVAKLIPVGTEKVDIIGRMAGSLRVKGDVVGPIGESWDAEK